MEAFLNPLEVRALEELKKLNCVNENPWRIAIKKVVAENEPTKFRGLIIDLKSQAADCADVMKRILGDAYEPVVAL
jgi:hypothetical protein